eukprot:s1322_g5.t1
MSCAGVLPRLPTPRCGCAAAALGGAIFVVGGRRDGDKLATVERFDLRLGHWESVLSLSGPRDACAAAALGSRLYVFGGRGVGVAGNQTLASSECFDVKTNQWTTLPSMPQATCGCAAAAAER